jgi:HAD superfamily hydrolase (TIGR01662 family)
VAERWVCLDVGETLIDETRVWTTWADVLGVTPLTFMAALGVVLARGGDHREVFELLGSPGWRERTADFAEAYGGFQSSDLYPDALSAIDNLRQEGYRLAIVANQPRERTAELRALGVEVDVMAMSDELGVHKPSPEFYVRSLELMGGVHAENVAYVGDRIDNDVLPSAAAGMRPVWIRRGPWALLAPGSPPEGTLVVESLTELTERIAEAWPAAVAS